MGATHSFPLTDGIKLQKIVKVLMDQVERGMDFQGNAYSLFQTAILLEDKVRERTRRLEMALRDLERSNHALSLANAQTETAQTRLMEAIESISEGFVHFDRDGRLVLCNTKFIEFWSSEGRDIREIIRPGVQFRDICRWTVENGLIADAGDKPEEWIDYRTHRHARPSEPIIVHLTNGRWLQVRERQTRDGGTVGIYTDITEIKIVEEQRREQELAEKSILLQSTLDSLAQGVSVFDRDLRLVAWNDRFVELLELPAWLAQTGASFSDYLTYRAARGDFNDASAAAIEARLDEVRLQDPIKGEQTLVNGTMLDVRLDSMPGGGFVTTYSDITDRQMAAAQLREAKETLERRVAERTAELTAVNSKLRQEIFERAAVEGALLRAKADAEKANMSKTRFLAAASHDLLQPLNAARLFVTTLSERPLAEREQEFVAHIDRALESVEALLGTLLDISKLDAGAVTTEKTDFIIGDLLTSLAEEYTPMAHKAGLELVVVPSSCVVRSDSALLARVLRNFLSNAIRYTVSGRILLGCRRHSRAVRIETWDTGPGIPEHAREEIFEEFHQLAHRDRPGEKSFGLGLAIVKHICRVLNHPAGVRSRLGKGSMFFIELPVGSTPQAIRQHRLASALVCDTLRDIRAMVIEDQPNILDGMRELLSGWGCSVLPAIDGQAALEHLHRGAPAPQVIIADYHLDGGFTGIDAIRAIRAALGTKTPALIITADCGRVVADAVRQEGLHLLRKPLKPAKLRALLSHLVDGQKPKTHETGHSVAA
ncbi:MAG: PAS-domain containing protein [Rhodospirillales bacterium]|nr:PAS-domain containing protein [Rhodospirillales bacterium]